MPSEQASDSPVIYGPFTAVTSASGRVYTPLDVLNAEEQQQISVNEWLPIQSV